MRRREAEVWDKVGVPGMEVGGEDGVREVKERVGWVDRRGGGASDEVSGGAAVESMAGGARETRCRG